MEGLPCGNCLAAFKSEQALAVHRRFCVRRETRYAGEDEMSCNGGADGEARQPDLTPKQRIAEKASAIGQPADVQHVVSGYEEAIAELFGDSFNEVPDWSKFTAQITGCATNPAGKKGSISLVQCTLKLPSRVFCKSSTI
jgi:hypothetical protein